MKYQIELRLAELLKKIDVYWLRHYFPPTIRDLMDLMDINSTSLISYYLRILEERGSITMERAHPVPFWVRDTIDRTGKQLFPTLTTNLPAKKG